jgi:membrane-bound ClpP family serine protease
MAAFFFFAISRVVKAHRQQATTGREELKGKSTTVKTTLNPCGTVFHEGEIWQAELDEGSAQPGDEVIITGVEGLKLFVTRNKGGK